MGKWVTIKQVTYYKGIYLNTGIKQLQKQLHYLDQTAIDIHRINHSKVFTMEHDTGI